MTINLRKDLYFYFSTIIISILYSLYYCLILSMDEEVELVSSKIFHSILVLIIQMIEGVILQSNKEKKKQIEITFPYDNLEKLKKSPIKETTSIKIKEKTSVNYYMETKEIIFYDVIYGMLSFTSELLLYYFLSVATSFNINIGVLYSFRCFEYIFLLMRFPYFHIKFRVFQMIGLSLTIISIGFIFLSLSPEYNSYMLIGTAMTISLFKFIQYCIFEYLHFKTKEATKLIAHSNYVDGLIGLMLVIFILISHKTKWIINDLQNIMKIVLASLFYYFALKISLRKESEYKHHRVYSSLNLIFVLLFDYLINYRSFSICEFLPICVISLSSVLMFVNENSLLIKKKEEK
jgi:hypothetical protein